MNASSLVCWKKTQMFVYYVWDGSHRDQSGKDTFFDESMELKYEKQQKHFTHNHTHSFPPVYTGLLHHLRPGQREMDCVGRGWRFGKYIILCGSVCVCLCVIRQIHGAADM